MELGAADELYFDQIREEMAKDEELTESPKERWFVQASLEEIQVILRIGLADKRSREAARRLVNRLYADGQGAGLVQLLDEPSATT